MFSTCHSHIVAIKNGLFLAMTFITEILFGIRGRWFKNDVAEKQIIWAGKQIMICPLLPKERYSIKKSPGQSYRSGPPMSILMTRVAEASSSIRNKSKDQLG